MKEFTKADPASKFARERKEAARAAAKAAPIRPELRRRIEAVDPAFLAKLERPTGGRKK